MKRLLGLVVVGTLALLARPAMADTKGGGNIAHTNDPEVYPSDFSVSLNENSTGVTDAILTNDGVWKVSVTGGVPTLYQQTGNPPNGSGCNSSGTYNANGGPDTPCNFRLYVLKGVINPATGQPGDRVVVIVYDLSGNRLFRLDGFFQDGNGITIN